VRKALGAVDFLEFSLAFRQWPHLVHERLRIEQHLAPQFRSGRGQVLALGDELGIAPPRDRAGLGEWSQSVLSQAGEATAPTVAG